MRQWIGLFIFLLLILCTCPQYATELDALGKARDSPSNFMRRGGNDEAEQTLNQLLACMDGLDSTRRICVLGATNRKEVLDPALIRPGRFDRIVTLKLPNAVGREDILRVHASKLPGFKECVGVDNEPGSLGKGNAVDLSAVAAVTRGLSGAELEFIVNESAIRAVRRVSSAISKGETNITPNVLPSDFVASVQNFNDTRRPNKDGVGDLLKNVWKQ
jgi:ATP-dependent Zn protease